MNNPQVAMSQPYGPSAEVYSFAIILWQLVSHQVPYAGLSSNAFHKRVVLEGARPPLGNKAWPAPLSQLFAECWSTPTERPATLGLQGMLQGGGRASGVCIISVGRIRRNRVK